MNRKIIDRITNRDIIEKLRRAITDKKEAIKKQAKIIEKQTQIIEELRSVVSEQGDAIEEFKRKFTESQEELERLHSRVLILAPEEAGVKIEP